jgi:glycerol-3-phosphate dehydrogenase (NAD(P)+)
VAIDEALRQIGQVVESVLTAVEVNRLALKHGLDLPISAAVHAVLHGEVTPVDALRRLMAREQKAEYPPGLFRTN